MSIGGLLLQSTLPVNVTYGQMLAPVGAATVSSLMMGFAWGVGSVMVPVVGLLGDYMGLPRALLCISEPCRCWRPGWRRSSAERAAVEPRPARWVDTRTRGSGCRAASSL